LLALTDTEALSVLLVQRGTTDTDLIRGGEPALYSLDHLLPPRQEKKTAISAHKTSVTFVGETIGDHDS